MKREQGGVKTKEIKGVALSQYKQDGLIVVNHQGNWVEAKILSSAPVVENDKLKLEISFDLQGGTNPETVTFAEPPEVVSFAVNDTLVDDSKSTAGDTFTIQEKTVIHKDGSIEYTLLQPDGKTFKGVPQEFLVAWKRTLDLEAKVKAKQTDLEALPKLQRRMLTEQRNAAQEEIRNVIAETPEVEHMPNFDASTVELIASKLEGLYKKAKDAVDKFERAVQHAKDTTEPDVPKVASEYDFFSETEQETKDRKEAADKYKEYKKKVRESFAKDLESKIDLIEGERQTALALEIVAKKNEYDQAVLAAQAPQPPQQGGGRNQQGGRTSMPPRFDRRLVQLSATVEKGFQDRKDEAQLKAHADLFKKLEFEAATNPLSKKLLDEVVKARRTQAGEDIAVPTINGVDATTGEAYKDYENDPPDDLHTSLYIIRNREILGKLIEDAPIPEGPKAKEKDEVFDFDKRTKELTEEGNRLLALIPREKDNNKTAKKDYLKLYKDVHNNIDALDYSKKLLSTAKSAEANYPGIDEVQLKELRVDHIRAIEEEFNKLEIEIQAKLDKDKQPTLKVAEKRETKDLKLDIPSSLIEELLRPRVAESRDLAKIILSEGVNEKGQLTNEALAAAQNLFDKKAPNDPVLLELLKQHDIADWSVFKKLWDSKIAYAAVQVLDKVVGGNMRARVSKELTFTEKADSIKGQLATRVGTTIALVGGAVWGVSAIAAATIGTGGVAGFAATVIGGAAGGAARGWLNKKIFESDFMKKRSEKLAKEMHEKKRAKILDQVLNDWFGVANGANGTTTNTAGELEGLPSFAAVISEVIEKISGEAQKAATDGPKPLTNEAAETMYEAALARMEVEPDEKTKMELRLAINRLQIEGDKLTGEVTRNVDPKIISVLEKVLKNYSGKNGVGAAAVSGAAMAVAFAADNSIARMAVGAATGLVAGWKEGDRREKAAELKEATQTIRKRIESVRNVNDWVNQQKDLNAAFGINERETYQTNVLELKRLLHGTALDSELAAICKVAVDEQGEKHVEPDLGLITLIRATVKDAERLGVYQEAAKDRMNAKKVLESLQNAGDKLEEKQKPESGFWKKTWKVTKKSVSALVGAAAGASAAYVMGNAVKQWKEILGGDHTATITDTTTGKEFDVAGLTAAERTNVLEAIRGGRSFTEMLAIHIPVAAEVAGNNKAPVVDTKSTAAVGADKIGSAIGKAHTYEPQTASEAPQTHVPETKPVTNIETAPETPTVREIGTVEVSRGGSALGTLNKIDDLKPDGLNAEGQAKWAEIMGDKNKFAAWKIEQLKENGYVFRDGKWGHPQTLHAGAKMEVTYDEGTKEFNARFVHGEDDHIDEFKTIHFRDRSGVSADLAEKMKHTQSENARFVAEIKSNGKLPQHEIDPRTAQAYDNSAKFNKVNKLFADSDVAKGYKIGSPVLDEFGNPKVMAPEYPAANVIADKSLLTELNGGAKLPGILNAESVKGIDALHDGQVVRVTLDNGKSVFGVPEFDLGKNAWILKGMSESPIMKAADADFTGRGKLVASDIPVNIPKPTHVTNLNVEARGGSGASGGTGSGEGGKAAAASEVKVTNADLKSSKISETKFTAPTEVKPVQEITPPAETKITPLSASEHASLDKAITKLDTMVEQFKGGSPQTAREIWRGLQAKLATVTESDPTYRSALTIADPAERAAKLANLVSQDSDFTPREQVLLMPVEGNEAAVKFITHQGDGQFGEAQVTFTPDGFMKVLANNEEYVFNLGPGNELKVNQNGFLVSRVEGGPELFLSLDFAAGDKPALVPLSTEDVTNLATRLTTAFK